MEKSARLQVEMWRLSVAGCRTETPPCTTLLLAALNEMIDIAATRAMAARIHPPGIVFALLFVLALLASLFAGYGMAGARTRSWVHIAGFAIVMTVSVYLILDLEFPRFGLIRLHEYDHVLVELRRSFE